MAIHVYATSPEGYSFHLQAQTLFCRVLARGADRASSADDAMPRQVSKLAQSSRHLTGRSRQSGCGGDLAVTGHLPSRDLADELCKNV